MPRTMKTRISHWVAGTLGILLCVAIASPAFTQTRESLSSLRTDVDQNTAGVDTNSLSIDLTDGRVTALEQRLEVVDANGLKIGNVEGLMGVQGGVWVVFRADGRLVPIWVQVEKFRGFAGLGGDRVRFESLDCSGPPMINTALGNDQPVPFPLTAVTAPAAGVPGRTIYVEVLDGIGQDLPMQSFLWQDGVCTTEVSPSMMHVFPTITIDSIDLDLFVPPFRVQ